MADNRPSPGLLERMEALHYRAAEVLYGCMPTPLNGALHITAPGLLDPDWNHVGRIRVVCGGEGDFLDRATRAAAAAGHPPTLAVTELTRPEGLEAMLPEEWGLSFTHAWLLFAGPSPPPRRMEGLSIAAVASNAEMEAFRRVFAEAFLENVGSEEREAFDAGLRGSFEGSWPARVVHYLATLGGEPVGIVSSVAVEDLAGGYNLGVRPKYRGRGLGGALTFHRLREAGRMGNCAFHLTEDPAVEAAQVRRGFRRVMTTRGYTLRSS